MDEKPIKKDLLWREKLNYVWCVLRFSKHIANWIVMNCEHCHHHELERIGKPIESDYENPYIAFDCFILEDLLTGRAVITDE